MYPAIKNGDPLLKQSIGSLDSRYTPDPHRGGRPATGADIIRRQATPSRPNVALGQPRPRIVVALYNYTAREHTDVSFIKGDRMEVIDDTESDWWRVVHLGTRQEGLIPWNFVAEEKSVESEE